MKYFITVYSLTTILLLVVYELTLIDYSINDRRDSFINDRS